MSQGTSLQAWWVGATDLPTCQAGWGFPRTWVPMEGWKRPQLAWVSSGGGTHPVPLPAGQSATPQLSSLLCPFNHSRPQDWGAGGEFLGPVFSPKGAQRWGNTEPWDAKAALLKQYVNPQLLHVQGGALVKV